MRPSSPAREGRELNSSPKEQSVRRITLRKIFFGLCRGSYGASRGDPRAQVFRASTLTQYSRLRTVASAQTNNPGHDRMRQLLRAGDGFNVSLGEEHALEPRRRPRCRARSPSPDSNRASDRPRRCCLSIAVVVGTPAIRRISARSRSSKACPWIMLDAAQPWAIACVWQLAIWRACHLRDPSR
jgi:hypothetical protein